MIKAKINRLYHGYASVRSTIVNKAMLNKEPLFIELKGTGEIMVVPCEDLIKGKWNKETFRSKHNPDEVYTLVDFTWKPTQQEKFNF